MTSDIESAMTLMFRDATQQSVTLELRNDADWDRFNKIRDMAAERERNATEKFERDKPALLAKAREDLINQAGAKTLEHPTPFGTDRFNKSAIDRSARIQVENAHAAHLLRIRSDEADAYAELKDNIQAREGVRDIARDAFTRATDRRMGQDRRMPDRAR